MLVPKSNLENPNHGTMVPSMANTLYIQTYSLTPPSHRVQVFQSLPWPQVDLIHLGMQTGSTNICERMGRSQDLSECCKVLGCHLVTKLLNFLVTKYSTVSSSLEDTLDNFMFPVL
ncbi:hypothetical protein AMECASPLE_032837 [Ameca splendens]|uniref:Uncharacterized protein n=1 Tax=Ameca splendens TaxID=208324 RepID=A0ABV1AGD2_9TELE